MFATVIDLCKSVIDFIHKDDEIRRDTKLKVSATLGQISEILQDTADKLKRDEYPHANCAALNTLSNHLHFTLMDLVNMDTLDNLHQLLVDASQIEKQFALRKDPETIPQIEEAAGEFKAMSMILKF